MEHRISVTQLARKLGGILGRVRCRGDSFVVERKGDPVARLVPISERALPSLRDALAAWQLAGGPDPGFADDLQRIQTADRPPEDASAW